MREFPKILYVKIIKERRPEYDCLVADIDYVKLSKAESTIDVAVYELIKIKHAVNKTELIN